MKSSQICNQNYFNCNTIYMDSMELQENWEQQKEKLKEKFALLTDNISIFSEDKN